MCIAALLVICTPRPLLLPSLDAISIFACNDLYPICVDHLIRFHLEGRALHDEGPYIVAQTIGMEMSLAQAQLQKREVSRLRRSVP